MKNIFYPLALTFIMFFFISCSSDSSDDMIPSPTPDPDPNPVEVTYTNTVKAITSSNCTASACHDNIAPQQGINLTNYAGVKSAFQSQGALAQIESGTMPKDTDDLSAATINKIKDWIANNYAQ